MESKHHFGDRLRAIRDVMNLTPEQHAELHKAAAAGEHPFIDMLKQFITNPEVLANVVKFLPIILALFKP